MLLARDAPRGKLKRHVTKSPYVRLNSCRRGECVNPVNDDVVCRVGRGRNACPFVTERRAMKKRDMWISIAVVAAAVLPMFLYSRGQGRIDVDAGGAAAELNLRHSFFKTRVIRAAAEPAVAKAGVYRLKRLSLSMGQDGRTWRVQSNGPWANLPRIRVKNSETTILKLGPPLVIKPTIRRDSVSVHIEFEIFGQAGERYEKFALRDNSIVRKAGVKIVDEKGNILQAGKFRYG